MYTFYILDDMKTIVDVGGQWDCFAQENGGVNTCSEHVKGRPIWDFIIDDNTRMWFETLLQLAKLKHDALVRHYRCDSPDLRRFMKMTIDAMHDHGFRVLHEVISVEERSQPVYIHCSGSPSHGDVIRCSSCGKIKVGSVWVEPDADIVMANRLNVTYTICPVCQ